jgi:hypothetical protein
MSATQAVVDAIYATAFGPVTGFENLSIIPLLAPGEREPGYLTLDEALAQGWVRFEEVGGGGSVPEIVVVNRGTKPVLLVDGEELIGAKQNRVLNLPVLVPPGAKTVLPVSCVEAGRWRQVSWHFDSARRVQFAEGRAQKMRDVTSSLRSSGARQSNQGAVWSAIAGKAARLNVQSDTSAMSDIFESMGGSLDGYVEAFTPVERQAGAIFFVNGRLVGLELFDAPATWRKLAPKVVRSYALDAIDRRGGKRVAPATDAAKDFISMVASGEVSMFPAVGDGEDVRLSGPGVIAAALLLNGEPVHLSAFAAAEN